MRFRSGDDSVRIRVAPDGTSVTRNDVGALSEQCRQPTAGVTHSMVSTRISKAFPLSPSSVINGRVRVTVDGGILTVSRTDTNATVLSGHLPTFRDAGCGHGCARITQSLSFEIDRGVFVRVDFLITQNVDIDIMLASAMWSPIQMECNTLTFEPDCA